MLHLKEGEICPKKDRCKFSEVNGQSCYGVCERNSSFSCDLDFLDDPVPAPRDPFQFCDLQI